MTLMTTSKRPIIGILCDRETIGPHPFHIAGEKYIKAVSEVMNAVPLLIPAINASNDYASLIPMLDGILLTGGYSMVDPLFYQEQAAPPSTKLDRFRDSTSFSLIQHSLIEQVPLLGICRGFQELNVALGGTLQQNLHLFDKGIEHREDKDVPLDEQYSESHSIKMVADGKLARILNKEETKVNSLHTQGILQLANGLTIEASADDGLVEAVSVTDAAHFSLAVQWHPEWQIEKNIDSQNLFNAFAEACRQRQNKK